MVELIAKNPSQLDRCLRLLYGEHVKFYVNVYEDSRGRIYYGIAIDADPQASARLREKYRIMIS